MSHAQPQQSQSQQPLPAAPPLPGMAPVRKRRRWFMWVFLALQALFVIWLVSAIASAHGTPADCNGLDASTCNSAANVGAGIAVVLILGLWMVVDVIVGVTWAVIRFARKN